MFAGVEEEEPLSKIRVNENIEEMTYL